MDHRELVYQLIERWGDKSLAEIKDGDSLLEDIRMDGDDYAMSFVPELQAKLRFEAPFDAWDSVVTVGDVIRVVEEYATRRDAGADGTE